MSKKLKIIIAIVSIIVVFAGGYVGNMFGLFSEGNYIKYSLSDNTINDSPIRNKTIIFLGSSVTYGYGSLGVSFADYLEKEDGIISVKEAVSGTTLADIKGNSYISRMKKIDKTIVADAFICQLSTNDATKNIPLGEISSSKEIDDFDTSTVAGAIEYIIAYAENTWKCPIVFYTSPQYDSESYKAMADTLLQIQKKWNITVIDLWSNEEFNNITEEQKKLYMVDDIHPTKSGYREWWLPEFRRTLYALL